MSEAEDVSGKGSNLTAVEAISVRLAEVTRLAEKLDARLCEAGARTRPVPMSTSATSSNSSLFSSTAIVSTESSTIHHNQPISTLAVSSATTTSSTSTSTSTSSIPPALPLRSTSSITSSNITSTSAVVSATTSSTSTSLTTSTVASILPLRTTSFITSPIFTPLSSCTTTIIPTAVLSFTTVTSTSTSLSTSSVAPPLPLRSISLATSSIPSTITSRIISTISTTESAATSTSMGSTVSSPGMSSAVSNSVVSTSAHLSSVPSNSTDTDGALQHLAVKDNFEEKSEAPCTSLYQLGDFECDKDDNTDKDNVDKSCDDSAAEDSIFENYVTATECSNTPTARSRSASFVTSPECEDLAAPATVTSTCSCSTWWNLEEPNLITTSANVSATMKEEETTKYPEISSIDTSLEVIKPEALEVNGLQPIEKIVSIEKTVEEKSGKIVKEVTETTTLRVSHDTRFGVASYKVTSNTLRDQRENVDVKEVKNIERIISPDVHTKINGLHHETDDSFASKLEPISHREELTKKMQDQDSEFLTRFTKTCEISEEETSQVASKTSKDLSLSLKEYRRHEDSGIEMSPTKKDDCLDGQDFLEKARKVSSYGGSSMNGERNSTSCCNCNCTHEAACFERYSGISLHHNLIGITTVTLANENRRRLPLHNPS